MAKSKAKPVQSWRDLQQDAGRMPKSKPARSRRLRLWTRTLMMLVTVVALGAGIWAIRHYGDPDAGFIGAGESRTLLELDFRTNGVMSRPWVEELLGDVLRQDLRNVDVHAIKDQLQAVGQVAHAAVAASFPSRLVVQLREREPALRVRVRGTDGGPQQLLIARDGHVYQGIGYPPETLRRIPGAAGLKLQRDRDGGFLPVEGIEEIADFLDAARREIPAISRHWRILNLEDWDPNAGFRPSLVRIRSAHIEELVFSMHQPVEQMRRLSGILEHTARYQMGQPTYIDLSFINESIIRNNP